MHGSLLSDGTTSPLSPWRRAARNVVNPPQMAPLTDYEKYIRTEELLALQKAPEALTCNDELQFQVVHQAHELYMKLIAHELGFACELLGKDDAARALTHLDRVTRVQHVLMRSIELLDTMAP